MLFPILTIFDKAYLFPSIFTFIIDADSEVVYNDQFTPMKGTLFVRENLVGFKGTFGDTFNADVSVNRKTQSGILTFQVPKQKLSTFQASCSTEKI